MEISVLMNRKNNNRLLKTFFLCNDVAHSRADYLNRTYPDTCDYKVVTLTQDDYDESDPVFDYDCGWQYSND